MEKEVPPRVCLPVFPIPIECGVGTTTEAVTTEGPQAAPVPRQQVKEKAEESPAEDVAVNLLASVAGFLVGVTGMWFWCLRGM